jgi:hypothetical protein
MLQLDQVYLVGRDQAKARKLAQELARLSQN